MITKQAKIEQILSYQIIQLKKFNDRQFSSNKYWSTNPKT
jgi:hypothetical protein